MRPAPESTPTAEPARHGISVVVVTLNERERIATCLESILAAEYPRSCLEIVVVDASSDDTPSVVARYPEARLLRSEKGFARQKNVGLRETTREIVAFTDADCAVFPDWLLRIDEAFRDERVAGVGGNAFAPPGLGLFGLCAASIGHPAGGAIGFDANVTPGPSGVEFVAGCNCAFRREWLELVGGFDSAFEAGGEDVDASRRVRAAGGRLEYPPELSVYHDPRQTLGDYVKWNKRVGISKYSLNLPSLLRIVVEPGFPLWSALALGVAVWLAATGRWTTLAVATVLGHLAFLVFLYVGARPYPLLLRRYRRIGLPLWAVLTVVPLLVYLRQVAMSVGELGEWRRRRSDSASG